MDATESEIERPKKQKQYYSGKKKKHTLSIQVVIDLVNLQILFTYFDLGSKNDFGIFKHSKLDVHQESEVRANKGYQGIVKWVEKSFIPFKKPRNGKLSEAQHQYNREGSERSECHTMNAPSNISIVFQPTTAKRSSPLKTSTPKTSTPAISMLPRVFCSVNSEAAKP